MTIEDAVFRKEGYFSPANLQNNLSFWEHEVLVDHPHKNTILNWLTGVKIEEFLNSFTSTTFQQQEVHSYYPQPREFENYVPPEFRSFMNEQVQEWVNLGVLRKWEDVRTKNDPLIPTVVSPLGIEANKPRAIWDGR